MARLETQAIDAYNDAHHFRAENPVTHLHEDEALVETDKLKAFHFLQDGKKGVSFVQLKSVRKRVSTKEHASLIQTAVEDELATEMKHDLEVNFNKIAPFGKEDTAKELEGAPGQGGEEPGHLGGRSGERRGGGDQAGGVPGADLAPCCAAQGVRHHGASGDAGDRRLQ